MINPSAGHAIRAGRPADLHDVAALLAEAFLHGDLAPWLIPHLDTRARIYPAYFALLAEPALDHGHVDLIDVIDGPRAAAVWYTVDGSGQPGIRDYDTRLAQITGRFLPRFAALDQAMYDHHPHQPHHYLAFLAVHPDHQRHGLGAALLRHHHSAIDSGATPAYLEATGTHNRALYARHGYLPQPTYRITGDDSPVLYPMWRPPVPMVDDSRHVNRSP